MTAEELAELNEALLPHHEVVTAEVQDSGTVYMHNKIVALTRVTDPIAFAAVYGVTVAP